MIDVLTNIHGLEKTGEDVFEKGRRAEIYYECEEGSEDLLQQWFARSRKWLSHRLGDELHLKCALSFEVVVCAHDDFLCAYSVGRSLGPEQRWSHSCAAGLGT